MSHYNHLGRLGKVGGSLPKGSKHLSRLFSILKGGAGSGNLGHAGRIGKRGGSAPKIGGGEVIIGNLKIKGASPEQLATVQELVNSLPAWHTSLVSDKVVSDTLEQYSHLPNYEELQAKAREAIQTGHMVIDFRKTLDDKTNPLTGESVKAIGGHIPNSITLDASLTGDNLKGILAHEIGHQVSYLGSKVTPTAELRFGRSYKPAGHSIEAPYKQDRAMHEHNKGVFGVGSEHYQRWQKGFNIINETTSKTYFPSTNADERFAQAYRAQVMGQKDQLTPSVGRFINKFFGKKPPAGSVGV